MIKISDEQFGLLTDYLRENYGINLSKKRVLVEGRLNNYLLQKGFSDYGSYLDMLFGDRSGAEMSNVINYLTTNYSYFMREWNHFDFFKNKILPEMVSSIRDNDLRIWSAGCSTGQEPYTIAMVLGDYFEEKSALWDTKVLATDISEKALTSAENGVYNDKALEEMPSYWKFRYFNKLSNDEWEVKKELKKEVLFRRFNLVEEFPFKKKFHVIFCRNVMIYFDAQTKRELFQKFYDVIEPDGYLIIGQSETIDRSVGLFKYVMPSIFKKVG